MSKPSRDDIRDVANEVLMHALEWKGEGAECRYCGASVPLMERFREINHKRYCAVRAAKRLLGEEGAR